MKLPLRKEPLLHFLFLLLEILIIQILSGGLITGYINIHIHHLILRFPLYVNQVTPTLRDLTNTEVHRDSFPAQSINTGSWTVATTWAASVIPTPTTPVYITNGATVTNTA